MLFKKLRVALVIFVGGAIALMLGGCASTALPAGTASPSVVTVLKTSPLAPAALGTFTLAPGKDPNLDTSLQLRAVTVVPHDGTFSAQLRQELMVELTAASLYDEKSSIVISGLLTESSVDTGMATGQGRLAARFSVDRNGKRVFEKEEAVESTWESSFIGAVAIPAARTNYGALYKALASKLFTDPEFRQALAP